ncbi:MAG: universal stress protein UspA [Alphaproteobacteria bacterium HGW-Alphaproteobacteria-8]|jgi:nucleotide-binding universal stress UspA family protein|nr:MAG: universal stress protein UspA [Alphaproteobacteria bacterium HGW-Alphaproteobacteria-8]
MFERILLAYDGSPCADEALQKAVALSRLCGAQLMILTIHRHHSMLEASLSVRRPDSDGDMDAAMRVHAREVAEAGKAMAIAAGAGDVHSYIKGGQPARGIVAFAGDHHADLIVIGSRGMGSMEAFLLGSVSHKVTGLAACPVLVV